MPPAQHGKGTLTPTQRTLSRSPSLLWLWGGQRGTWSSLPLPCTQEFHRPAQAPVQQGESYPLKNSAPGASTVRRSDWPSKDKNNTANPHLLLALGLLGLQSPGYIFKCCIFWSFFNLGLPDWRCKENVLPTPAPQITFPSYFPKESQTIGDCSRRAFTYLAAVKRI